MIQKMLASRAKKSSPKTAPKGPAPPDSVSRKITTAPRIPRAVETFATALMSPFSPSAIGAKVPDLYSFPTTSYHVKSTFTLGGQTNFGVVCLPNPYATLIDVGIPCVLTKGGANRFTANTAIYGLTTEALMASICTDWRMVGSGIRIRNLQAPISATGRVYVAVVPASDGLPPSAQLSATALSVPGYDAVLGNCGLPSSGLCTSSGIQNLPLSNDYVVSDLVSGAEIDINHAVFNPYFYTMKAAQYSSVYNSLLSQGDASLALTSAGTVYQNNFRDNMSIQGSAAIIVYCEGFPTTASLPTIEIDIIQHFETTPVVAGTAASGIVPTPASLPACCSGSTATVERVLQVANAPNNIIKEVQSSLAAARQVDTAMTGGLLTKMVNGPGKRMLGSATGGWSDMLW